MVVESVTIVRVDQNESSSGGEAPERGEKERETLARLQLLHLDVFIEDLVVCEAQPVERGRGRVAEWSPGKVEEPLFFCFHQFHLKSCSHEFNNTLSHNPIQLH